MADLDSHSQNGVGAENDWNISETKKHCLKYIQNKVLRKLLFFLYFRLNDAFGWTT